MQLELQPWGQITDEVSVESSRKHMEGIVLQYLK